MTIESSGTDPGRLLGFLGEQCKQRTWRTPARRGALPLVRPGTQAPGECGRPALRFVSGAKNGAAAGQATQGDDDQQADDSCEGSDQERSRSDHASGRKGRAIGEEHANGGDHERRRSQRTQAACQGGGAQPDDD